MFEIGFWELVVVGVVALWVLGPERLPGVLRVCARWLIRFKHSFQTIQREFTKEFEQTSRNLSSPTQEQKSDEK
jgi:sec-independent protein translocase protein TatB